MRAKALAIGTIIIAIVGIGLTTLFWPQPPSPELQLTIPVEHKVTALWFDAAAQRVIAGDETGAILIWNSDTGQLIDQWHAHDEAVTALAWAEQTQQLLSGGNEGAIKSWDLTTGREIFRLFLLATEAYDPTEASLGGVLSLAIHPTQLRAVATGDNGHIQIFDLQTGKILQNWSVIPEELETHFYRIYQAAFIANDKLISSSYNKLTIWDSTGHMEQFLDGYSGLALWADPLAKRITTVDGSGGIVQWTTDDHKPTTLELTKPWRLSTAQIAPSGDYVVHGGAEVITSVIPFITSEKDYNLYLSSLTDGANLFLLRGHNQVVQIVSLSPDTSSIASYGKDKTIRIWQNPLH